MGMHTELHFNAELKDVTPEVVLNVLDYMLHHWETEEPPLPDHPFFACGRWCVLFTMDSYYFDADTHSTLRFDDTAGAHFLCIRSNLKNYDGEIEKFLDWISPYLAKHDGDFLGFYRYEEAEQPTLIFHRQEIERA